MLRARSQISNRLVENCPSHSRLSKKRCHTADRLRRYKVLDNVEISTDSEREKIVLCQVVQRTLGTCCLIRSSSLLRASPDIDGST